MLISVFFAAHWTGTPAGHKRHDLFSVCRPSVSPLRSSCSPGKQSLVAITLADVRKTEVYSLTQDQTQKDAGPGPPPGWEKRVAHQPSRPPPAGCGAPARAGQSIYVEPGRSLPRAWGRWPAQAPRRRQQCWVKGGRMSPAPSVCVLTPARLPAVTHRRPRLDPLSSPCRRSPSPRARPAAAWPGQPRPGEAAQRARRGPAGGAAGGGRALPGAALHGPRWDGSGRAAARYGAAMEIGTEISRKIRVREKQPGRSPCARGQGPTPAPARGVRPRRWLTVRAPSGHPWRPGRRGPGSAGFPSLGGRRRRGEPGDAGGLRARRSPGRDASREVNVALGRGPGPAARRAAVASSSPGAAGRGLGHRRPGARGCPERSGRRWCQPLPPAGGGCQLLPLGVALEVPAGMNDLLKPSGTFVFAPWERKVCA